MLNLTNSCISPSQKPAQPAFCPLKERVELADRTNWSHIPTASAQSTAELAKKKSVLNQMAGKTEDIHFFSSQAKMHTGSEGVKPAKVS
jgi:hypothetical protein